MSVLLAVIHYPRITTLYM